MKEYLKKIIGAFFLLGILSVFMAGCVEHRYVREHHRHSPEFYHRHPHRAPAAGVDIEIHN